MQVKIHRVRSHETPNIGLDLIEVEQGEKLEIQQKIKETKRTRKQVLPWQSIDT